MATKKKSIRWFVLYSVSGGVDLLQIILDATGVGIAVSETLEAIMPFVLVILLWLFHIINLKRLISIIIAGGSDALTGGLMPLWIADVAYIHWDTLNQEKAEEQAEAQAQFMQSNLPKPRYRDGRQEPVNVETSRNSNPLHMDGIRAPGGGLR